ncbi:MAG: heavy metal translocating P-type ATPase [Candidatus Binatia bacterium]
MIPAADSGCYHCGLPIPPGVVLRMEIDGRARAMCCAGCIAVAELIGESGLNAYYRYRDAPGANPEAAAAQLDELLRYDAPALQKSFVRDGDGDARSVTLSIEGMRCAACVWLLERHLRAQPGVLEARVNLGAGRAEVSWNDAETRLSALLTEVARLGYAARPYRPDWQEAARRDEYRSALRRLVVAGLGAMQVMMYGVGLYAGALEGMGEEHRVLLRVVSGLVATPILFYSARPFFSGAWRDLHNRRLGMDVPVALALAIAYAASVYATVMRSGEVYFDSVAMFVFFLSVGRFVEMRARQRAADAVDAALRRPPETATRLAGDGAAEVVSIYELAPNDRVLVRPGETFPVDGRIVAGSGWVNESMLTGEHWPRARQAGDEVAGGTQNGESPLTVVALRTGADTAWSAIVRLVDLAGQARPGIARLADRVAHVFVPAVLTVSLATWLAWWQIDPSRAFWVALSVLVVTCPCALSLATPAALTAAAGGALRRGLLLRSGNALEVLQRTTHVVFDKTGTLTLGRFRRRGTQPLAELDDARCVALAAALERYSEHPIARAFDDVDASLLTARDVTASAGAGVEGVIDGRRLRIGAPSWVRALSSGAAAPSDSADVLLGDDLGPLCRFELEDTPRPGARETVARLRAAGLGVSVVSGDAPGAVAALAASLGIADARAAASPADKLRIVQDLQRAGAVVLMVGDGVNDAPVLGAAQVSIAMGGGTDLARSRADGVLLKEDLAAIADVVDLARATRRVMRQNLAWSISYNLLALPLAAMGHITPWWAALGMSLSSLVVVLNAVRLGRPPRDGRGAVPIARATSVTTAAQAPNGSSAMTAAPASSVRASSAPAAAGAPVRLARELAA